MSDGQSNYKQVRAHIEERLEPLRRLRQRRVWLIANIAAFLLMNTVIYNDPKNSMFFGTEVVGANSDYPFTHYFPYPLLILVSVIWLVLIVMHIASVTMAFRHENQIQREIEKEMELEKMRLQAELMRYGNVPQRQPALNPDEENEEKPKRKMFLSDDGELVTQDETSLQRHRSAIRRR